MYWVGFNLLLVCTLTNVYARESQFKTWYHDAVLEAMLSCIKRYSLDTNDLKLLLSGNIPKHSTTKCLLSCTYKKEGSLTSVGFYNTYHLLEQAYNFKHTHENLTTREKEWLIEDAVEMGENCWEVNSKTVTDGTRGCERAILLYECLQKNSDKILNRDFKIKYIYTVERAKLLCLRESHFMSQDVVFDMIGDNMPKEHETKCLLACAYKYEGTMTRDGMYDPEHIIKMALKFLNRNRNPHERELIIEQATQMSDACTKVNSVEVTDKERGCERAALIFQCRKENGAKEFQGLLT